VQSRRRRSRSADSIKGHMDQIEESHLIGLEAQVKKSIQPIEGVTNEMTYPLNSMPQTSFTKAKSSDSDVVGSLISPGKPSANKRNNNSSSYNNRRTSYPSNNCKTDGQSRGCGRRHDRDDDDANPNAGRRSGGNSGRQWSTRSGTATGTSRDASGRYQSNGSNQGNNGNYYC